LSIKAQTKEYKLNRQDGQRPSLQTG